MKDKSFFEVQTSASGVKAEIVSKYFTVWASIVGKRSSSLGYVDLFAGAGVYGDGKKSTPILILESAIRAHSTWGSKLRVVFNDVSEESIAALNGAISALPGHEALLPRVQVTCSPVDDSKIESLKKWRHPSLVFLDPWGYKGLSVKLIQAALSRQMTDVIFFFNYNRVNAAITNEFMEENINAFFTPERAERLRQAVIAVGENAKKREQIVLQAVLDEVTLNGKYYTAHFKFDVPDAKKTSHYIILVTKNPAGIKPMKEIMAKVSSVKNEGIASMAFSPKAAEAQCQFSLFPADLIGELAKTLLIRFAGQTLTLEAIFQLHNIGTNYVIRNYRDAVLRLEKDGRVTCNPAAASRPSRNGAATLAEHVQISFP